MITRESLQERYAKKPTEKLLEIMDHQHNYTELAVSVAEEELAKREVTEEEVQNYEAEQLHKIETYIEKNICDDLTLVQKNLFYFIWVPILNFPFKMNFRQDGYLLKLKQANYYSLLGFLFFMVAGILSAIFDFSNITSLAIWITGYILAYLFDEYFNRQQQIKRLQKKFDQVAEEQKDREED